MRDTAKARRMMKLLTEQEDALQRAKEFLKKCEAFTGSSYSPLSLRAERIVQELEKNVRMIRAELARIVNRVTEEDL